MCKSLFNWLFGEKDPNIFSKVKEYVKFHFDVIAVQYSKITA